MTVGRIPNIEGGIQPTLLTTTGDIMYASSASNPARLGIGSSAQVLTVASGVPSWATPASGGMTLLSTTTLSGTSTTISSISQSYTHLYFSIYGVTNATSTGGFQILPNNATDVYVTFQGYDDQTGGFSQGTENAGLRLTRGDLNRTLTNNSFSGYFFNYSSTSQFKNAAVYSSYNNASTAGYTAQQSSGTYRANTAITSLVFKIIGSPSLSTGTVLLYGVK